MKKKQMLAPILVFFPLTLSLLVNSLMQSPPDLWYRGLSKPSWNPPGWVFGPVWTILYLTMGWASLRIWTQRKKELRTAFWALAVYALQLALNLLWTPLFFSFHRPYWALIDIGALVFAIGLATALFYRIDRWAGRLFVPYLAWTAFAALLNWRIVQLNG